MRGAIYDIYSCVWHVLFLHQNQKEEDLISYSASMASVSIHKSVVDEDDEELEYHHHPHPHRLSMCSSNTYEEDDLVVAGDEGLCMAGLVSDGDDADGELSDKGVGLGSSSDSDKEMNCSSLPATPTRLRIRHGLPQESLKEYASENEVQVKKKRNQTRRRSSSVSFRERWMNNLSNSSPTRESECLVIARPKGGSRSLCMDMEEVKACRDLGFDLEHEMLELPGRISRSCSTLDDSSGGTSPIANWRVSSPGDDPRDVKARLKVWAQAVALATTRYCS